MHSKSIHDPHCVAGRVANQGKLRNIKKYKSVDNNILQ
jgi:hypothetical protein